MAERNKKGDSSERQPLKSTRKEQQPREQSMSDLEQNNIKDAKKLDRIDEEHSLSLKDYYNALDLLDKGEVSFSSLPDFIVDSLINADDETFAEFLNLRKLSKEEEESNAKQDKTMDHPIAKGKSDNSKRLFDDDLFESDGSSNPPPLVLPPVGTVKYDESFIEMVIQIVNRARDNKNNNDDSIKSNEKRKERLLEKDDSLPRIEQARRGKVSATEDSILLDHCSVKEDELLFLSDDKVPSFLYKDDIEQTIGNCSRIQHKSETRDIIEQFLSYETGNPRSNASLIPFDDELDQSCESFDAIQLEDIDEAKNEEPIFKDDSIKEEDTTDFSKDYSSWLCFDNEEEYVTFKEKRGQLSINETEIKQEKNQVATEQVCNTQKQGSSDTEDQSKSATPPISPLNVPPGATTYNSKNEESDKCQLRDTHRKIPSVDVDSRKPTKSKNDMSRENPVFNKMNNTVVMKHEKLKKAIEQINKRKEEAKRNAHTTTNEEIEIEECNIGSSSSLSSLNIESYIIATSTPRRNDSQHTNNDSSGLFKTTPAKRKSPDDDSKKDSNDSSPKKTYSSSRTDYGSSPVRRRLIEAHVNDKNRNTTPSPPLVFPQNASKK